MPKFKVIAIEEVNYEEVTVEASSQEEAEEKVEQMIVEDRIKQVAVTCRSYLTEEG